MKITIDTPDFNVFDFSRICEEVAKAYNWNDGYVVHEDSNVVDFQIDNLNYRGRMEGYSFVYREVDESDGTEFEEESDFDWIPVIGASYMVKAKDEDGKDVFLAVGLD